jgi:hypothetical protein
LKQHRTIKRITTFKDLKHALRDVLRTVDIFKCQQDGAVKIEIDEYLEQALARKSIDRVIGKIAPINELSAEEVRALQAAMLMYFAPHVQEATAKAKHGLNVMLRKSKVPKTRLMPATAS